MSHFWLITIIMHGLAIFLLRRWLGPLGTLYSAWGTCAIAMIYLFAVGAHLLGTGAYVYIDFGRWLFCLQLIDSHFLFCFDLLAIICSFIILSLIFVALYFGIEYMFREAFINRLLYLLNLFAISVVVLFVAYDFFVILVAWEGIGLFSLLLVNFYATRIYTLKAALKTFVFSRISDMFMMGALLLTLVLFQSTDLSLIFIQVPLYAFHFFLCGSYWVHSLSTLAFGIAMAGVIKSAQFFFHVWLPDAMEAPTPASALIHSSTLVVAGIFLIMRFSILFEFSLAVNMGLIWLGSTTLVFAAVTAVMQHDIKKLVAYSTISQIGYLVTGCGYGCFEETLTYLIMHAYNKAFLFIVVGYIVHFFSGNTDMRFMGNLAPYAPDIAALVFLIGLNLSGTPYSAGYAAKEFLLFQMWLDNAVALYAQSCWLISFFFTPTYMLLLTFSVLFNFKRSAIAVYRPLMAWNADTRSSRVTHNAAFTVVTAPTAALFFAGFYILFINAGAVYFATLYGALGVGELFASWGTSAGASSLNLDLHSSAVGIILQYAVLFSSAFALYFLTRNFLNISTYR